MSNYLFESGITTLSKRIDLVTDKNEQFSNYIDHNSRKVNLETNISWIIAKMILVFDIPRENSVSKFKEYLEVYNITNTPKICFNSLLDKNWIRIILDAIEFPSQVRRQFRQLEKGENDGVSETDLKTLTYLYHFKQQAFDLKLTVSKGKISNYLSHEELNLLLENEIIISNEIDCFSVKENDYFNYLKNEICSSIWILLTRKLNDDSERIINFVNIIIHFDIFWPDKLPNFFNYKELKQLQELAILCLLNEKDLENEGNEFNKIWLDSPLYSHIELSYDIPQFNISGDSPFEVLLKISELKKKHHWLYEDQESVRLKYGLLLNIILQTVTINHYNNGDFQVIIDMLSNVKRPYLIYHSCWIIQKYYPLLIPYFLIDLKTTSLPFMLLNEIEIKENATDKKDTDTSFDNKKINELKTEFFKTIFDLFLDKISSDQDITEVSSEILYQLFKFQAKVFYNNTSYSNQINHIEERNRFEYMFKAFSEIRTSGHYTGYTRSRVFPKHLNYLIENVITNQIFYDKNKYLDFNCAQFELIYQILHLSYENIYEKELSIIEKELLFNNRNNLISHWKTLYLEYFTTDEIEILNPETKEIEIQKISRKSDPSGIEILNWGHFWLHVNEYNSINEVLKKIESCLNCDNTDSKDFSAINLETKAKLKFFMKSVSLGLLAIKRDKTHFTFSFQNIESLINELELILQSYTIKHCVSDLNHQRISVFNEIASSLNNDIYFEPTIKIVFSALNKVDEGSLIEFHKSLLENNLNILFLLTILNLTNSEVVISLITKKIETIDLEQFINSVSHVDQWKNSVIESLNSSTHFEIAGPIISKLEAWLINVTIPRDPFSNFIFHTKLMLAFKRKNIDELIQIKLPEKKHVTAPINSLENKRKYYIALHWGYNINEFDKAITIFNDLFSINPNDANVRYHIFHLETLLNVKSGNTDQLFRIKIEWDQFVENATKDEQVNLKLIQPNINHTLLFHYCHIRDYESVDRIIQSLPELLKFDQNIVESIFQSYNQRQLSINAILYLSNTESFYQNKDDEIIEIVQRLRVTIDNTKRISDLSAAYNQIYSMPFHELPMVVPRSLNGSSNIQEFIFQEIIQASFILLEKINSVSQITWENKYNDLLLAILRLRFAVWNWNITDQPRAGESKSGGGDLGSLDFLISSAGNSIALIEAMILDSGNKPKTEEHITKCFTYLDQSKVHYVVVYFRGPKENFETSWESYKSNVLTIEYKDDQKLRKDGFMDTSQELDKNKIKKGITNHVFGVNIFHVYINISSISLYDKKMD